MSRILLYLLFLQPLYCLKWDSSHNFTLAKDQVAKIELTDKHDKIKFLIKFRWTLYANKRLVLLLNKDGYPSQYILQQRYKANSIRINLSDDYMDEFDRSFLRISFKEFKDSKAKLALFFSDPKKRFVVKYIDPKH
jgi:hypothetical protein